MVNSNPVTASVFSLTLNSEAKQDRSVSVLLCLHLRSVVLAGLR